MDAASRCNMHGMSSGALYGLQCYMMHGCNAIGNVQWPHSLYPLHGARAMRAVVLCPQHFVFPDCSCSDTAKASGTPEHLLAMLVCYP